MFNMNHFYYFYLVAETGSVTAAARVLRISQPALSKQLKVFESAIDTKLWEKQGRKLQLTAAGLSLFGQARSIFEKAERLSREFSSLPTFEREQLRLGLGSDIERSFASELIGQFFVLHPRREMRPSLSAHSIEGASIARYLREHVIDACITERSFSGTHLCKAASILSSICLAVPAAYAHRLKGSRKDDLRNTVEALDLPWILPSTNIRFRFDVEHIAEKHRFELRRILETDSMMTIVRSVENGVGIALIPKHYLGAAREPKKILSLEKFRSMPKTSLSLWIRKADRESPDIKILVRAFETVCS